MRNFNPLNLRGDAGAIYETYVFNKLKFNQPITASLFFYRAQSKSEIDFVRVNNAKFLLYEVKSGKNNKIPRTMIEFEQKYKDKVDIKKQYVIN